MVTVAGGFPPLPPWPPCPRPPWFPASAGFLLLAKSWLEPRRYWSAKKFLLLRVTDDARRSSRTRAAVAAWFLRRSPHYPASRTARRSQFPAKDGGTDGKERNHIGMEKRHKARGGRRVVFAAVAL